MKIAISPSVSGRQAAPLFSRLRTAAGQSDPFSVYRQLSAMGPVVRAPWGGHVVTDYELCDHVLRSRHHYLEPDAAWRAGQGDNTRWTARSSIEISHTLPALNGDAHARVRRAAGRMFDRQALGDLLSPVERVTERLLDGFGERLADGEADLHALVSEGLPIGTIGHWMHLPKTDYALLRDLTRDMVYPQELLPSASQLARSDDAVAMLRAYFVNLIADRRARPSTDPVSGWIAAWDRIEPDRDKADENVYYLSLFVVLAALETTATMLSQMVVNILSHPAQWDWLAHHPEDVPGAVEESLRYDPPTHVISRIAAADTELAGTAVRADEMVHLMVGAAGRDPRRHPDPDSFNIHRTRPVHLAFSGGVHYCLGAPLARLEACTLLRALLRRFPRLTLARAPQWHPRIAFRRPRTVDLALA